MTPKANVIPNASQLRNKNPTITAIPPKLIEAIASGTDLLTWEMALQVGQRYVPNPLLSHIFLNGIESHRHFGQIICYTPKELESCRNLMLTETIRRKSKTKTIKNAPQSGICLTHISIFDCSV
jgi:hypothetical protein